MSSLFVLHTIKRKRKRGSNKGVESSGGERWLLDSDSGGNGNRKIVLVSGKRHEEIKIGMVSSESGGNEQKNS